MKAAVYYGKHDLRVEEVPDKKPNPDEVLIRVKYCGVCGTDAHIFNGDGGSSNVIPPLIHGHEFSGVITEIGSEVKGLKVGDRVSGDPNIMCEECYFCRNGMEHFCTSNIGLGTTADGAFAEYVVMRASHVFRIPDSMDFMTAAMCEPVSCCVHGIDLCNIRADHSVLVIGGGPIGVIMLQLAKRSGASTVILSEPVAGKRELALELGADIAVNPLEDDVEKILSETVSNIDCVIECVGNTRTQKDALRFAGKGATAMFFGLASPDESIDIKPDMIFKKELRVTSSFINPYTFPRAIQILGAGQADVRGIITNVIPLEELPQVFVNPEYRRSGKVMVQLSE